MNRLLAGLILLGASLFASADIVTVPIPGSPGLSVTVGTGANALPLRDIRTNSAAVNVTMSDDDLRNVPLNFNFPFFGKTFNNSWMMSNGVVMFQDPWQSGAGGLCCEGVNLTNTTDPRYNYSIYPLHSDLYAWNPNSHYYLSEPTAMTYGWYNVSQCCNANGGNSFELKINNAGAVDVRIAGALVNWNRVTSGMAGDLSKGEYYQYYHGQGVNVPYGTGFSWQALGGTGTDLCTTNPTSSPSCPNYVTVMCTTNPLFSQQCPGYAQAFFDQQCSANPLYNVACPGYAVAYLDYQCSIDPLYSTTCRGYEKAYHDRQCSISALYATDCEGYDKAYFAYQCELNGLYDTKCPNYATAYATAQALKPVVVETPTAVVTTSVSEPTQVAVIADPIVNSVVTTTATSASPAQSATATVPLVKMEPAVPATTAVSAPAPVAAAPAEQKPTSDQPKTARQDMQERRQAAARAAAVEKGKSLANDMGKAASMEDQIQVQNVVSQSMAFVPGFDAYGKAMLPDGVGYKPYTVYVNQNNVDNRRLGRGLFGPTDQLHNEIVNSQYNRGK